MQAGTHVIELATGRFGVCQSTAVNGMIEVRWQLKNGYSWSRCSKIVARDSVQAVSTFEAKKEAECKVVREQAKHYQNKAIKMARMYKMPLREVLRLMEESQ